MSDTLTQSNNPLQPKKRHKRLYIVLVFFAMACLALLVKLFSIQVIDNNNYQKQALRQYESKVEIAAERGDIYDRRGQRIATTIQGVSVAVDPKVVKSPKKICMVLSQITGESEAYYRDKISNSYSSFVWLERSLPSAFSDALDTIQDPGLILSRESQRYFPFEDVAASVLGFTTIDNQGAGGIELEWDSLLQGDDGVMVYMRDGKGKTRPYPNFPVVEAEKGYSLHVTLDMKIQSIVAAELKKQVEDVKAASGVVIAISPSTGEIIAMASYPNFNPNERSTFSFENTRNRPITDMYEPGSTFKLITAAALLEENAVHPDDSVYGHEGVFRDNRITITDSHPLGKITFAQALQESSNIIFANLAQERLSDDVLYKYSRDFGFGMVTDIDIPGEVKGIVRKPHNFDNTTKRFMAFGYQLAGTALQIVNAYAAIANDGIMNKPYLVQKITHTTKDFSEDIAPAPIRRVVSTQTARALSDLLVRVVDSGTGKAAKIAGIPIAGKTGTAQQLINGKYSKSNYTASFVGFFPAITPQFPSAKPELAIIIMMDKPRRGYYGGQVAAPVFRAITRQILAAGVYPGIQMDYTAALPEIVDTSLENYSHQNMIRVPELRGLTVQTSMELLQELGVQLVHEQQSAKKAEKQDIIYAQKPAAGEQIDRAAPVLTNGMRTVKKPSVLELPLRRALLMLHSKQIKTTVQGRGIVRSQKWFQNDSTLECTLICR